ncbi:MAG TPA: type II toxin-antitoxin system VapC family toxin [Verrucomicrobiae bacterium]|nr:type II toxin-antitoxin system VapC family toxin [Verrucomicrobiae bacterium]
MKKLKLLDSHAALVYLKGEKGHEKVKAALADAERSGVPLLMSEINIGEVGYILLRAKLTNNLDDFLSQFLSLPIRPVPVDFDLVIEAAKIKARYPLSYADAFAVATALRNDAAIITGDPEFKAVMKLVQIDWL